MKIENKRLTPFTKIINGKRVYLCDYRGKCKNKAYKEVYPSLLGGKHENFGWSFFM
ncbi:hypothetical protein KAI04_00475 [Candidatus Pacearchaeota archaeon]|nr:hypothetical protein [Candidatus Pacearchaeota archaeon]